ncbi:GAF and ANTAR domain-containing protein [Streptomyces beijiangensis]|uniref:GAF and ANTAR domain-containing protein n=1 Tax=Streptomyces beijiangensis TaxID=163361 RepID=A0A939F4G1_9ACTN|nr:GAF and ANTAR domain-containing protein [Streptomyces beijiangensis]MBO0511508.1 GAF and ANTAR domain-containing protein [Streptomyces beijiangensis]
MSTPDMRLADAFVALAGTPDDSYDVARHLSVLTGHSVALLGVGAVGAVLRAGDQGAVRVSASDPRVTQLETGAVDRCEGPGHDCCRTGALPETVLDTAPAHQRWPHYTPRALALGYTRVAALPLTVREETVGALVLLHSRSTPLTPVELALGRSLATAAATALVRERELTRSRVLTSQLELALTSRIVIEQAKGVLANRMTLSMDQAFDVLRSHARSHRVKLADVALDVVEGRLNIADPHAA